MKKKIRFIMLYGCLLLVTVVAGQKDMWDDMKNHYKEASSDYISVYQDTTGRLMQIILIRHGEPDLDKKGWRKREGVIQYMNDYDSVGVVPFSKSPVDPGSLITDTVFHSSLPRAANTAKIAFEAYFNLVSAYRFREFERKCMKFINIKLPLKFWTTGSRILWLMGLNDKDIENKRKARIRAEKNAFFLIEKAENNEHVVLVAHGLHNKYLKKYLKRNAWKKVYSNGHGYLSVIIMAKE